MTTPLRAACLLALAVITGCDTGTGPHEYGAVVLSVTAVEYDERGMPGLAFAIENTGDRPIYHLDVIVRPEPFNGVEHSAQNAGPPLDPGGLDTLTVPLPSRASHDDYDCYRYVVSGSVSQAVPGTTTRPAFVYRDDGTCG